MSEKKDVKLKQLYFLCYSVKKMIHVGKYEDAFKAVCESMARFPNNPEPHNLLGILLEMKGNHALAMKHFRIAWVLDPTFQPANLNISNFGNVLSCTKYAYEEDHHEKEKKYEYGIIYDDQHVGHVERIK